MESIVAIVGFLGAGKTTLLKHLTRSYSKAGWNPFVILNDYENAFVDLQQFSGQIEPQWIRALNGSCICCSGINELREFVNCIPARDQGITLIEANGTSDACALMGFLGVGIAERFLPPVQLSVVDVKNWQHRGEYNELEANQVQVSSLIVLTHMDEASEDRCEEVINQLNKLNPTAKILSLDELDISLLPQLMPSHNEAKKLDHKKAHWASCSSDLPDLPDKECVEDICNALPNSILRVKGCCKIAQQYINFERCPDGTVYIKPSTSTPLTGPKLLTVGPGSKPELLKSVIATSLEKAKSRTAK